MCTACTEEKSRAQEKWLLSNARLKLVAHGARSWAARVVACAARRRSHLRHPPSAFLNAGSENRMLFFQFFAFALGAFGFRCPAHQNFESVIAILANVFVNRHTIPHQQKVFLKIGSAEILAGRKNYLHPPPLNTSLVGRIFPRYATASASNSPLTRRILMLMVPSTSICPPVPSPKEKT